MLTRSRVGKDVCAGASTETARQCNHFEIKRKKKKSQGEDAALGAHPIPPESSGSEEKEPVLFLLGGKHRTPGNDTVCNHIYQYIMLIPI